MKSKKVAIVVAILLIFSLVFVSCGKNEIKEEVVEESIEDSEEKDDVISIEKQEGEVIIRVAGLKGPTTIGLANIIENNPNELYDVDFNMHVLPEEIVAGISKGEIDIAAVPANLAATLYNKTEGNVEVGAINTLGVLHIIENGDTLTDIKDLEGKTIYTVGKGTSPEGVLNSVIKGNNLENVNIEFKQEASEIAAILNQEENVIAMLPEPFVSVVTLKNENIKRVFNMNEEWMKVNDTPQVTGVLIARSEFIEDNKEAFDAFLHDYEESITYANENVAEVSKIVEKMEIVPEGLGEKSIPNIDMEYIDGSKMEEILSNYLEKIFEFEPKLVGGKLPDERFYYKK